MNDVTFCDIKKKCVSYLLIELCTSPVKINKCDVINKIIAFGGEILGLGIVWTEAIRYISRYSKCDMIRIAIHIASHIRSMN